MFRRQLNRDKIVKILNGIPCAEMEDISVVAFSSAEHVLVNAAGALKRVLIGDIAQTSHSHPTPSVLSVGDLRLDGNLNDIYTVNGNSIVLRCQDWVGSRLILGGDFGLYISTNNAPTIRIDGVQGHSVALNNSNPHATRGLTLPNDAAAGVILCHSLNQYACHLEDKTDVAEIANALDRVESATGITYTQDGEQRVGVTYEDMEQIGLPGLVHKSEGVGDCDRINTVGLIPLLLQGVKKLTQRVRALYAVVQQLSARIEAIEQGVKL